MVQTADGLGAFIRRHTAAFLCFALAGSLLTACGSHKENVQELSGQPAAAVSSSAAPAPAERTVKDEMGNEVKLPAAPKRIFAPYLEDCLLKLGIKPVVQWANGTEGHPYLKVELQGVPTLDFSSGLPSPEALLAYNPDFIILHNANYASKGYESYSKIAPTYVFNNATGDVEKTLAVLGDLLGKSSEADQAQKAYDQKVTEAKAKLAKVAEGKKASIIRFAPRGISMMGANYFAGHVLHQELGLGKVKLVEKENSANVSMEILPDIDADYIFTINQGGQGTDRIKEMMASPIWKTMPAVKQGHVYEVDEAHWLGGGLIAYEKIMDDVVRLLVK
ncbi:ABC transporter substrate-binding protein [Paenibacillus filicis]|uniref:ABC transporter substrate-binding protein n=1 Tax=Paenibacillus filicis TaxID=669464 RepID=A0ABU9DM40_9BACL